MPPPPAKALCSTCTDAVRACSLQKILLAGSVSLLAVVPAMADQALAASKSCMGCHGIERKVVGPAFKDVAAKYRADKTAVEHLTRKIKQGGSGVWGKVTMPSNPQVSDADARKLAMWILSVP